MSSPVVSVIVPVYNAEKYLKPCVDSIIKQTLTDIEILFIDDGSKDSSLDILKKYAEKDKRIKIIKQKNSGPGVARNNGVSKAKGKYISFMDSDDFFEPDLLESLYNKIEKTNSDIAVCRFWVFNQETQLNELPDFDVNINLLPKNNFFSATSCSEYILHMCIPVVWTSLYRREFIINNDIKFAIAPRAEDNLFAHTAVAMAGKVCFLNRRLIHYRRFFHNSLTDKANKYWLNSFTVNCQIRDYFIKHNKYEQIKTSFLRQTLSHIIHYSIRLLDEPIKSIASFYAQRYLKEEFGLDLYDISQYLDDYTYSFYQKIYRHYNDTTILEKYLQDRPQKIIPIVYAANEKYIPILGVSLQSLLEHINQENFYDIYILHSDISATSENCLERLTKENVRVTCINIQDKLPKDSDLYSQFHYSKEMFYRFLIPQIIYGYDKILYIDTDTIITHDIAELYNTDIADFPLAGCVQPLQKNFQKYCTRKLKCKPESYINSGVLLFNTKKWNELNLSEKCFALVGKIGKWRAPDQDILNIVCKNNIKYLDDRWNAIATIKLRLKKFYFSHHFKNECLKLNNAYILHYTSFLKPWQYRNSAEAEIWWKYARKSLFYERLLT